MELDDHFEDFTTASEWELFIARLEQLLCECMGKPVEPANVSYNWLVIHEKISFADFPFKFSYYKRLDNGSSKGVDVQLGSSGTEMGSSSLKSSDTDLQPPEFLNGAISTDCDFPPKYSPHIVSEYFSLYEFVVLSPSGLEPVRKESKLKILLSSACIAINNSNCNFPVFIQFHHWNQAYFSGIAEFSGIRTSFQMVMLQPNSHLPNHLSTLLDVFKSKIGSNLRSSVGISAHFFYKIKSWASEINCDSYPPELFDLIQLQVGSSIVKDNQKVNTQWRQFYVHTMFLPFGSLDDPFLNLDLVAGWPSLTEDVVVDSPSYTDLEPENAQEWYFTLKTDPNAEFRLHELVDGIWKLRGDKRTTEQVLGKPIDKKTDAQNYSSALDKITRNPVVPDSVAGIQKALSTSRRHAYYNPDPNAYEDLGPLSKEQMDLLMDFLFPDAKAGTFYPYPSSFQDAHKFNKDYINSVWENLQGIKSAPVGSFVWRISIVAGYLLAYAKLGSPSAVSHMWAEIILELRYRVDNSTLICGLELGSPNIGTCLLNQKLQMLNCCIEKKIARDSKQNERSRNADVLNSDVEESEDDDEFFDCDENMHEAENVEIKLNKPSGRLRKNGKLRLFRTGEPMYIPITQDPAPLTEDVMEEQSKVMIELGNNAQGSELRAKMMSAALLSDMESFKAANPGAELEDFVRWYSPRDWIESEDAADEFGNVVGELSPRMKLPGNLWLEVWSTANAAPARRQKRLFDDTKEAEKVLHWLGTRTLSDISQLLFPCLIHSTTLKILDEADTLPFDYKLPTSLSQNVVQLSRCFGYVALLDNNIDELNSYKSLVMKNVLQCEKEITQIRSFQMKFPSESIEEIIQKGEPIRDVSNMDLFPNFIKVPGGKKSELGKSIYDLFIKDAQENMIPNLGADQELEKPKFGKPFKRVFVLKYNPPSKTHDSNSSIGLPQRMSCLLKNDVVVLAGTFSTKTDLS